MLFIMTLVGAWMLVENYKIPDMSVMIGKEKIKCSTLKNTIKNSLNDKQDLFKFAFKKNDLKNIKYIKIGSNVILDFGDNPPDKISIKDVLLNSSGEYMYAEHVDKLTTEIPFMKENGKYSFTIGVNIASQFSSYYEENETIFRGYLITAYWDKREYQYAFVIKTNLSAN